MEHKRYVHWGLEHMGQRIVNLDRETCEKLQGAVKRRKTSYKHLVRDLIAAVFEDIDNDINGMKSTRAVLCMDKEADNE